MTFTASGFDNRSALPRDRLEYSKPMTWVLSSGGTTVTMQLNGDTHFGRKHLLLPTRNADKKAEDDKAYGSGIYWLAGWRTGVDDHVERKMHKRVDHRQRLDEDEGMDDELRWAQKYNSNADMNTVLNLVDTSQRSITARKAAEVCALELNASVLALNVAADVTFDFARQCVLTSDGANITATSTMTVRIQKTAPDTYLFIHRAG